MLLANAPFVPRPWHLPTYYLGLPLTSSTAP